MRKGKIDDLSLHQLTGPKQKGKDGYKKLMQTLQGSLDQLENINIRPEYLIAEPALTVAQLTQLKNSTINSTHKNQRTASGSKKKKKYPYTNMQFALFCSIVDEAKILPMHADENRTDFCARVSERFKLEITADSARKFFHQNMDIKKTDKHLKNVRLIIFPLIKPEIVDSLNFFINSKTKTFG